MIIKYHPSTTPLQPLRDFTSDELQEIVEGFNYRQAQMPDKPIARITDSGHILIEGWGFNVVIHSTTDSGSYLAYVDDTSG